MKRMSAFLSALLTAAFFSAFAAAALEHAEWDAVADEDNNYGTFNGAAADYVLDGGMETAWQKQSGIMDENGVISRECYVSLTWRDEMQIESVSIWWRTSTRCEPSKDGYVLQYRTGTGASAVWEDADAVYSYNSSYMAGRRDEHYYSCDTVTPDKPIRTKSIRVLVKKGVDTQRGYSPKINEIEVAAKPGESEPVGPTELTSRPGGSVSSEPPVSSGTAVSSDITTSSPESVQSQTQTVTSEPSQSETQTVSAEPSGDGINELLPWIVLAAVSAAVIVIAAALIAKGSVPKKNK